MLIKFYTTDGTKIFVRVYNDKWKQCFRRSCKAQITDIYKTNDGILIIKVLENNQCSLYRRVLI